MFILQHGPTAGSLNIILSDTPSRAGGIMGRRKKKKERKRGEVGVVDVLHDGMDAAYHMVASTTVV